jgi:4-amino-4-deoxy-L-arabinose transferase-like glycosyltransferase
VLPGSDGVLRCKENDVSANTTRHSPRATLLLYGCATALIICIHLATNGVLGFHIDELYYLACGRHLAFGYVDFPPVVPLLARFETGLLGVTPWSLRVLPALLGGVNVILCGAFVRKLGGSLKLQALALVIGISMPAIIGTWLFQTVIFDQVMWMVSLYLFLCLVKEPKPGTWVLLGIALGVGLEVKFTIVALIAGIVIAVLFTPPLRVQLRTRYPWIAACIALVIWTPNLIWQAVNGFPTVAYVLSHQSSTGGSGSFLIGFLILLALVAPLWVAGVISLFRSRDLRALGIACAFPIVIFFFAGKYYYPAPTFPLIMAAGLLALSRIKRPKVRSSLVIVVALASLLDLVGLSKITLPITSPDHLHASGLDSFYGDTVGWVPITQQVTTTYGSLPASERSQTVIVSSYYGVTGALDLYGDAMLLPASFSPQLSDYFWLPRNLSATYALMVGYSPSDIEWMCTSPKLVAHLSVPYDVQNLEQGMPVTFCPLKEPLPQEWIGLKNFS